MKTGRDFSTSERHQIIQECLSTGKPYAEVWFKYSGQDEEHGIILKWMRKLGYGDQAIPRRRNFIANNFSMPQSKDTINPQTENFENLQLKKRIAELEAQLKDAQMKAIAFSTMVDIAEKELKISIRKKFNTKP